MPVALTILQLDTDFPRVAGDVACAETYRCDVEFLRIPNATVRQVVQAHPEKIPIGPFEDALRAAKGDVVATSCGFLSFWQDHLAAQTPKPFISSALTALDDLSLFYTPEELLILTFDDASLTPAHLGRHATYVTGIIGLPADMYLTQVIRQNAPALDVARASAELSAFVAAHQRPAHRHILLECTNLPPYKEAIVGATGLGVTDILTQIEAARVGTVAGRFLAS